MFKGPGARAFFGAETENLSGNQKNLPLHNTPGTVPYAQRKISGQKASKPGLAEVLQLYLGIHAVARK
jgi:hypothetical protein